MKKTTSLFLAILVIAFLSGCDKQDNNGHELISYGAAFSYWLKDTAYVISSVAILLILAGYSYYLFIELPKTSDTSTGHIIGLVVILAIAIGVIFGIPNGTHLNTTVEAAKAGHMI